MANAMKFSYDAQTNQISGPAEYMKTRYAAMMEQIYSGQSVVFNFSQQGCPGSSVVTGVLVALQTDYAGWLGQRQMDAMREGK